uniref:Putative secreted protein n=1 Tax=Anopheles triannulatus TaxID=58253 RepID=A0A2M4B1F3_9DIPT
MQQHLFFLLLLLLPLAHCVLRRTACALLRRTELQQQHADDVSSRFWKRRLLLLLSGGCRRAGTVPLKERSYTPAHTVCHSLCTDWKFTLDLFCFLRETRAGTDTGNRTISLACAPRGVM